MKRNALRNGTKHFWGVVVGIRVCIILELQYLSVPEDVGIRTYHSLAWILWNTVKGKNMTCKSGEEFWISKTVETYVSNTWYHIILLKCSSTLNNCT